MTDDKHFKRAVRARQEKTGERYSAARKQLKEGARTGHALEGVASQLPIVFDERGVSAAVAIEGDAVTVTVESIPEAYRALGVVRFCRVKPLPTSLTRNHSAAICITAMPRH